ncbi:MAG: dihydrolipoyl dehydrogenase [Clostridiales Family XIII bacterium]|jgi:dihydrolipoamide dehydrogenase|nr:dihydrolipoyl dehydrogenase [Clostridiales Family XIII bacterium]
MEQKTLYDLIILGGGPAGYFAAERAADSGFRVLLLEERSLGGVCLNEGCIPTKSLLYAAKLAALARHGGDYGVFCENVTLDHGKAVERKNIVVQKLVGGVASALKQKKIDAKRARGTVTGRTGAGFAVSADGEAYEGARLLVCTGSEAIVPPIDGIREALESGFAVTSREILEIGSVPQRLAIIGGGAIGLELANYFAIAGAEVAVIEMLPEVGGAIDADIAKTLRADLKKLGIRFLLETKAAGFEAGGVRVTHAGGDELVPADKALLSIGRRPRAAGAGLESIGVHTENGAVATDGHMRTNVPGIWAAGDVNGKLMLAHTAYREAAVAVSDMLGIPDAMRYGAIPQIIYTSPEAAGVGETEKSAAEKGYAFDKAVLPLQYSGRYVAENASGDGFVKLLAEKNTGRLLGVHMIGSYASEIILAAAVMVGSKWPKETLKKIVYPHPTVGEILRAALIDLK